jgi:phosphohistidine phosphatase
MLFVPEVILSSPLLRAMQTAEILCEAFGIKGLHVSDALASGDHGQLFADVTGKRRERVLAVGHEPFMSGSISFALTGSDDAVRLTCKKGAAALVTFDGAAVGGTGSLEWLIQPAALRLAGGGGADRR